MKKSVAALYAIVLIVLIGIIVWLLHKGQDLPVPGTLVVSPLSDTVIEGSSHWWGHPMAILILQFILIIFLSRVLSYVAIRMRQPVIISEIIAGILLGPSLLGAIFPELFTMLFPGSSLDNLYIISQIGLLLFMFIIGMELDIRILKTQARTAVIVSNVGIVVPFLVGMALAYYLFTDYATNKATFSSFALFLGVIMSISAFPVLSRIIQERGLSKSSLGFMAITCAIADDVAAWCLLAAVVAMVKAGSFVDALGTILFAGLYVCVMLLVIRPLLQKVGAVYGSREIFNKRIVGLVVLILLGSSWIAELIGVHALFGAFLAGIVMPNNLSFKKIITEKMEDISLVFLLPLFFVVTGLRTDVGVLVSWPSWAVMGAVLLAAVMSKLGSISIAGRLTGQSWRESLTLGALLNTRGLMGIVVLNIGYDLGILSTEIFTMLVLTVIATTVLTGPLLNWVEKYSAPEVAEEDEFVRNAFRIFISFGPPKMGSTLLRLADQLTLKHNKIIDITALHITPSAEVKPYEAVLYEKEGFQPIRATAQLLGLKLNTVYKNTEDVDKEILNTVQQGGFDLVLVGAARPIFTERATGGVLKHLLEESPVNVGVLVDRGFVMAESILLLLGSEEDRALLQYAYRFRTSNRARVTVLKMGDGQTVDLKDSESPYYKIASSFREVIEQRIPDKQLLSHYNLILISLDLWNEINSIRTTWIRDCPSILVVKHHQDLPSDIEFKEMKERREA